MAKNKLNASQMKALKTRKPRAAEVAPPSYKPSVYLDDANLPNGKDLKVGDKVLLKGTVESTTQRQRKGEKKPKTDISVGIEHIATHNKKVPSISK